MRLTSFRRRAHQRGISLIIGLLALLVISLACITLTRSVDTANLAAGNFAFRQASVQASDIGVELAFNAMPNIITTSLDADIANTYYATTLDSRAVAQTINWDAVASTQAAGNTIQYVIERLCSGSLPVTDVQSNCIHDQAAANGSNKSGATVFSASSALFYRVTVRVTGPQNTVAMTQAMFSF